MINISIKMAGNPVQQTTFTNNQLHMDIQDAMGAQFDGTLTAAAMSLRARSAKLGCDCRFSLSASTRWKSPSHAILSQDPKPPYPYETEDVSYENKGIHLAGTQTLPRGQGPFPRCR